MKKKVKKFKKRKSIGWKEIITLSLIFAIIGFLGITCFIGQIRNQVVSAQKYYLQEARQQREMQEELEYLRKKAKQQDIKDKQQLKATIKADKTYPIVKIKHNNTTYTIDSQAFLYSSDIHTNQDDAFLYSRNGTLSDRLAITNKLIKQGFSTQDAFYFMFGNIQPRLNNIFSVIEHESKDAQVKFFPELNSMFQFIPEVDKVEVDKQQFFADFLTLLNNYNLNNTKNNVIHIKTIKTKPQYTTENLKQNTVLRSTFKTSFAGGQTGRIANISKALSFVNGVVLKPNEVFSFNARTAPHTLENGYSTAKIIENGKFVDGVGGGICQASTTLYNAVVMADLEIKSVQNHSLPIGYVKLPFDAMVSTGSDLIFKNNTDYPIYFKAWCDRTDAYVEVYGKPFEKGLEIKRKSVLIETLEDNQPIIQKDETGEYAMLIKENGGSYTQKQATKGFVYEGYIQYVKNGEVIQEKLVRKCKYKPQKAIVYVAKT